MGIDYFDNKILCKIGKIYYIGVRARKGTIDFPGMPMRTRTERYFSPLSNTMNPIKYNTLEQAKKARRKLSIKRLDLETRIFEIRIKQLKS